MNILQERTIEFQLPVLTVIIKNKQRREVPAKTEYLVEPFFQAGEYDLKFLGIHVIRLTHSALHPVDKRHARDGNMCVQLICLTMQRHELIVPCQWGGFRSSPLSGHGQ